MSEAMYLPGYFFIVIFIVGFYVCYKDVAASRKIKEEEDNEQLYKRRDRKGVLELCLGA